MCTLIEIFDSTQYENIIAPVRLEIKRLVYIGTKDTMTVEKTDNLRFFLNRINLNVPIEFHYVETDDSVGIKNKFIKIVKSYPDAVFDATGGEDVLLTYVGAIAQSHSVPIIRIDHETKKLSFHNCEEIPYSINPKKISVADLISLEGGKIVSTCNISSFSHDDMEEIKNVFEVNGADSYAYSAVCNYLSEHFSDDERSFTLYKDKFAAFNVNTRAKIFEILIQKGLIIKTDENEKTLTYAVKSPVVSLCLKKAGNALELYTAVAASSLECLSDINTGTKIEWDITSKKHETQNEIDVIAVKSDIPVFISCKNGDVKKEALYELDAVAKALGGPYARKVLVCSALPTLSKNSLLERAKDMEIFVIYNTDTMSFDRFTTYLNDSLTADFEKAE